MSRYLKSIISLSIPIIIQRLVFQVQSLTDKLFLGSLDTKYLSALGSSQFPFNTTLDSLVALSTGIVIIVANAFGAGKKKDIGETVSSALFYNSLISLVLMALWLFGSNFIFTLLQVDADIKIYCIQYTQICSIYFAVAGIDTTFQAFLQGMGKTWVILIGGLIKVVFNVFISWVLIFGFWGFPALGIVGAGIGTLLANLLSCGFILGYCLLTQKKLLWSQKERIHFLSIKPYQQGIKLGVPVALEYLIWNMSNLVLIGFLNSFSYVATAIFTLTTGIEVIAYAFYCGNAVSTMTLIGQRLGAGKPEQGRQLFWTCLVLNVVIVAFFVLLFIFAGKGLLGFFTKDIELIESAAPYLVWTGIIMIPKSINVITGNTFKAYKDTMWLLYMQIFGSTVVVSVVFILVRVFHLGISAVYITLLIDESIRAFINFYRYQTHCVGKKNPVPEF
jgi:putative MATE family efflux protein